MTTIDADVRRRIYGLLMVLAGCLFFAVRGYHDQTLALHSRDFKPVYAGARCLIDGCDPYDSIQIEHSFLQHGGDLSDRVPFVPFNANYPPSALFLVIPLAMLPFGVAYLLWLGMGIVLFCAAALCAADLCIGRRALVVQCVLAAFVATSTILVMLGQPAMISISLAVIAVWCFLRRRYVVPGIVAFAVSLTLKPHVAGLVWLFFLLSARARAHAEDAGTEASGVRGWSFRRLALTTLAATVVLMAPGMLLAFHHPASAHWPQELHTNLVGIGARGNFSDPGPENPDAVSIASQQALFSLIRDAPRFYDLVAYAVFLPLFLVWGYRVMRPGAGPLVGGRGGVEARDLMALAAAAALSFLPIYHRQYDTRLLLLMFPALAVLASGYRWMGRAAVALAVVATVATSHQFVHMGPWIGHHVAHWPPLVWLVLFRPIPLTLLLLACFFLYCMAWLAIEEKKA